MSSAPGGGGAALARFDGLERAVHWTTAALTFVLLATSAVLYIPSVAASVGRRDLMRDAHVAAGFLLPVPLLLGLAARRGGALRADLRRLDRWDPADRGWLRSLGRRRGPGPGKFHPGQKLNAAFVAGATVVMLGTGAMLRWPDPFRLSWRTGATFVHDWLALVFTVVIFGHIGMALIRPAALRGMIVGRMSSAFAARHHPRWAGDDAGEPDGPTRGSTGRVRAVSAVGAALAVAVVVVGVVPEWGSSTTGLAGPAGGASLVPLGSAGGPGDPDGAKEVDGVDDGDPEAVARRFQAAMERNDYESAFRLLAPTSPEAVSKETFFKARLLAQDDQYVDPGKSEPVPLGIDVFKRLPGPGSDRRLLLAVTMSNGTKAWRGVEMRQAAGRWRVQSFRLFQEDPCRDPLYAPKWGCNR